MHFGDVEEAPSVHILQEIHSLAEGDCSELSRGLAV